MGDSYPTNELLSPSSVVEKYVLDGKEDTLKFSSGRNVVLSLTSEGGCTRDRDSARVHTSTLTDFKGDGRSHNSRLLTVRGDLIACHLHSEATGDVVRVIDRVSRNRHVIKNLKDAPVDLQYAAHAPMLAVLDSKCNIDIYKVDKDCQDVEKYVSIENVPQREEDESDSARVVWCPYSPENPNDPTDQCHMVAIFKGSRVTIINLLTLHEQFGNEPIEYASAVKVDEAVLTVNLEEKVSVVCISPDSTAVAIGRESGVVSFYIVNGSEIRFAHNWNPGLKTAISHLFFLDDISGNEATSKTEPERFWRHCIVAGEGGRRLALFECEEWKCLGTLRFDCELDISKFTVHIDPKMRYIHLLDTDGANVFCVELDYRSASPRFLSITQTSFCRPLQSICPYDVTDESYAGESDDDALDLNDNDEEGEGDVTAHYIAIGQKSLVQLDIHLEKTEVVAVPTEQSQESAVHDEEETPTLLLPSTSQVMPDSGGNSAQSWHRLEKDDVDQRFADINAKLEQIAFRVDQADSERRAAATNDHIIQLLQQFKEEFSLREDRLLANISDLIETNRTETISVVRNALNENSVAVENSIQANHKQSSDAISQRVSEKMRDSLVTLVVPALDRICSQLFKQMNETFRLGMEQYMAQFRALHSATLAAVAVSATPAPSMSVSADRQQLAQMIKNRQAPLAFETVLNQADQGALEFVCNNVDPDEFFASSTLNQPVLLSLLQQLSIRLESDTDLKFRYFEHILERLKPDDRDTGPMVPGVLNSLNAGLQEIQTLSSNTALKRQARVLGQLVRNLRQ